MRVLMKVELPVEAANAGIKSGKLVETIQAFLKERKPEAAYFLDSNGKRCGIIVLDLKDPSEIPAIAEPWFLSLNASVEIHPAMTIEDLAKAGPAIEQAVKKYG